MIKDTSEIKKRIIQVLNLKGPLLPTQIARETQIDTLFTSAFLSELISEKKIKSSHMRVGSSAIYFLEEQKEQLEKFGEYLKSKEKEAFKLLKEKSFLEDNEQEASIKVALRQIKDFAIPLEKEGKIIWRYFTVSEKEYKIKEKPVIKKEKRLDIFDKEKPKKTKSATKKTSKTNSQKKNEKFFNKIKEHLSKNNIEILDIGGFSKNDLFLIIKENDQKKFLAAFNKKRVIEADIIKANKKAIELNLSYTILSFGETSKKLNNFINAIKNLSNIEKIE